MHNDNNVVFEIIFDFIVEWFMFEDLFIDEKINETEQAEEIFVNQPISIHFECLKING